MQAAFNRGENAVCSWRATTNSETGWSLENNCRAAHRQLRVAIDEEVEHGKLTFPDGKPRAEVSPEHRVFAEALCAMPPSVFLGGSVPGRCVERVLGVFEEQCKGLSVIPAAKAPEASTDAGVQGETAVEPRAWVKSVTSSDNKEREKALSDPLLGKLVGSCEGTSDTCAPSVTELHLEKASKTELLLRFPGPTQRLVLLRPTDRKRWRVIWSTEYTVSEMMCDVAEPFFVSAEHLTSADHESLELSVRSGSITSPAAGGGCSYNVTTSWFDLYGARLAHVFSCYEGTIVPEGPFPRKVLSSRGELFAPDESGTYRQIAGPGLE